MTLLLSIALPGLEERSSGISIETTCGTEMVAGPQTQPQAIARKLERSGRVKKKGKTIVGASLSHPSHGIMQLKETAYRSFPCGIPAAAPAQNWLS